MARLTTTMNSPGNRGFFILGGGRQEMSEVARLSDAELVAAIDALRDASPEEQEGTCLALAEKYGEEVGARARTLLAVDERATEITAQAPAAPRPVLRRRSMKELNAGSGRGVVVALKPQTQAKAEPEPEPEPEPVPERAKNAGKTVLKPDAPYDNASVYVLKHCLVNGV